MSSPTASMSNTSAPNTPAIFHEESPRRADEILPVVYAELRRLARSWMSREKPGQTLQTTALVHEAYLRLGGDGSKVWDNRGHYFAAAAEAMRRILVERARRYRREKHGGGRRRITLEAGIVSCEEAGPEILDLDRALGQLEARDPTMAKVAKLRYFVGLSVAETAETLGMSVRSVHRAWTGARAWLYREITRGRDAPPREVRT